MSRGSLLRHWKFEHPSALLLRHPLHDLSEASWNVELNHVCHVVLLVQPSWLELVSHCATGWISSKAYIGEVSNSLGGKADPTFELEKPSPLGCSHGGRSSSCEVWVRGASSHKGEHRWTTGRVLTLRGRHRRSPTSAKAACCRVA